MNRIVVAILIAASITGCGKQTSKEPQLQENTEEYFKAHGIVQGQPNELRIGGTLFRFPAGVGLNPYTAQRDIKTVDGSPMKLSSKECLEQGKCERVATSIVKGEADKVTFYLDGARDFAPVASSFGSRGGDPTIRVEISSGYKEHPSKDVIPAQKSILRSQRDMKEIGLREYLFADRKNACDAHLFYLATDIKTPRGGSLIINCEPKYDAESGCVDEPAYCTVTYQALQEFAVTYGFGGDFFLREWQSAHQAVTRFVDSVVTK